LTVWRFRRARRRGDVQADPARLDEDAGGRLERERRLLVTE